MPKYTEPGALATIPAPMVRTGTTDAPVPYNLITTGPQGAVYSTAYTEPAGDGQQAVGYLPAYTIGGPVPAGRGRS